MILIPENKMEKLLSLNDQLIVYGVLNTAND